MNQKVIEKWGSGETKPKDFVFPILQPNTTLEVQIKTCGQFIYVTNKWTKIITEKVGIKKKVTTSVARHSHATILNDLWGINGVYFRTTRALKFKYNREFSGII